jgi:uncharacterized protein (DUF58 family)
MMQGMTPLEQKQTKIVAAGFGGLFILWYIYLLFTSHQKWFHLAWLAMLVYTVIQVYHFFLSQKEIDSQINALKTQLKTQVSLTVTKPDLIVEQDDKKSVTSKSSLEKRRARSPDSAVKDPLIKPQP